MKFAQYLHDTQTPEWKKAYIDYRGLKKRIGAIRKAQHGLDVYALSSDESPDENENTRNARRPSDVDSDDSVHSVHFSEARSSINLPASMTPAKGDTHSDSPCKGPAFHTDLVQTSLPVTSTARRNRLSFNFSSLREATRTRRLSGWNNGTGDDSQRHPDPLAALPLHELLNHLTPREVSFFTMLDSQLDKVEGFYLAREREMLNRGRMLQIQLNELNDHRKLFHEAYTKVSWVTSLLITTKKRLQLHHSMGDYPTISSTIASQMAKTPKAPQAGTRVDPPMDSYESSASASGLPALPTLKKFGKRMKELEAEEDANDSSEEAGSSKYGGKVPRSRPLSADPDNYLYAKRKLKKAVLEHYRGLEVLHNYRVLNITGFRKALKKFEKVTKISVQQQYMTEKVEKTAFASDGTIRQMMTQMEDLYAIAFASGDKKRANKRLRTGGSTRTHHFSAFRAGMYLGLGIPVFFQGLVRVLQQETQQAVPAWDVLLFIYGVLFVPVLFSVLVGINLLVWAESRINYSFIFELDVLTQLDHRKYFEIPAILLSTLFTAFWLSFNVTNWPSLSPTIWPLVWMAFAALVIFDPLAVQSRPSRYWLIKNIAKQFISGLKPVEFTDFWMGDQFCSMTFTLTNIPFIVCVYSFDFSPDWTRKCTPTSRHWPIGFSCAILPLLLRLFQSLKRYYDSGLITHLINGGKYGSGIVSVIFYFFWRHSDEVRGTFFVLWCLTNVFSSLYGLAWDLLMDWSILEVHCKYPLLRSDLVYANHIPLYYFAIVSNTVIRFLWVIYIPSRGPNMLVRTFIVGFFEMLRRWQWNFFRLENEHLGNMDQYRVTREVPLPYAFNDIRRDDADDDDYQNLRVKQ